jgi:Domain of unknown function (DUF397)
MNDITIRGTAFRKSTYSAGMGQCVEVGGQSRGLVVVRDSKDADGTRIPVSSADWREFVSRIKIGKARALTRSPAGKQWIDLLLGILSREHGRPRLMSRGRPCSRPLQPDRSRCYATRQER